MALVFLLVLGIGLLAGYLLTMDNSMDTSTDVIRTTVMEAPEESQSYQPSWKLIETFEGVYGDYQSFITRGEKFKITYSAEPLVNYDINYLEVQLSQNGRILESGYVSWDPYESPKSKTSTIEVNKGPGTYYLFINTYELKNWKVKVYDYY